MLALFLTIVEAVCFNRGFYAWQYRQNNTAESIKIYDQGLMNATNTLLDYIRNKRDDILVREKVNGIEREIFDARETAHMVYVKQLYMNGINFRMVIFLIGLGILVTLCIINRKAVYDVILNAYRNGLIILAGLLGTLTVRACIDFDTFWMGFHHVFFRNDLFLLDPDISIMINMFPAELFFAIVMLIVIAFAVSAVAIGIGIRILRSVIKKNGAG